MNLTSPKNWKMVKLGELADVKGGKRLPLGSDLVSYKTSHPYIRVTDIQDGKIKKDQLQFVPDEVFEKISRYIVDTNDVIISIVGSVGLVAYIDQDLHKASLTENCVRITGYKKNIDPKFLFWYLISRVGQHDIASKTVGSTQPKLPIYNIRDLEIPLPSIDEQKEIAAILSSLDDKIELLRRENKTLENIAQALFREWFVEFRFPGYEKVKMVDGMPEGWKIGTVMDVIDRLSISYKCDKDDLDPQGKTPIIDQGTTGLYGYTKRDPDMQASTENPVIVFTNHTCNLWFINYPFCAIQNVIPFRGKDGYDEYFVYFMTKGQVNFIEYKGHWPDFEIKEYVIPPVEIAGQFSEKAKPLIHKIWNNDSEIKTLSRLRDDLLNKIFNV